MGESKGLLSTLTGKLPREIIQLYIYALQTAFLDKSLPIEVRYLAIIQLKNGIDKYWRKTAQKYVSYHTVDKKDTI